MIILLQVKETYCYVCPDLVKEYQKFDTTPGENINNCILCCCLFLSKNSKSENLSNTTLISSFLFPDSRFRQYKGTDLKTKKV
jgi:hypothetical protein